jgi:CRISPR/Cas system-associated exonuclease Cas4 (RecB family)
MSKYYNAKRNSGLYNPDSDKPFPLSRSKLELFIDCPRCFYLDRRLGVNRPPGFPFTINSAIDHLLKKEFDIHRTGDRQHPLIKAYGVDARPAAHKMLNTWRNNFKGVRFHHKPTNLTIFGAIDDLWINSKDEYIVVDYKATSTKDEILELNKDFHKTYKRQVDIYQWLLRKNGLKVSDKGYFVYANGNTDAEAFDAKLEFDVTLIEYKGNDSWVENTVIEAHKSLNANKLPESSRECDYCAYREAAFTEEMEY